MEGNLWAKTQKAIKKAPQEVGEEKIEDDVVEASNDESLMEVHKEGTTKAIVEEEQKENQNIPEIQMLSVSPQIDIVKVKDVPDTTIQNINPLIEEDMQKILTDSTSKKQLCMILCW